jgi:hypothetical protein
MIWDITDDVWKELVSKRMAFLFLCVKLALKMDYCRAGGMAQW